MRGRPGKEKGSYPYAEKAWKVKGHIPVCGASLRWPWAGWRPSWPCPAAPSSPRTRRHRPPLHSATQGPPSHSEHSSEPLLLYKRFQQERRPVVVIGRHHEPVLEKSDQWRETSRWSLPYSRSIFNSHLMTFYKDDISPFILKSLNIFFFFAFLVGVNPTVSLSPEVETIL